MDEADNENMWEISPSNQLRKDSSDQFDQHSSSCHLSSPVVSDYAFGPAQCNNHPEPPVLLAIPHEINMPDQNDSEKNSMSRQCIC